MKPGEPDGSILQQAYWPADKSVSLVESTVGGLLAQRAHSHADQLAIVGVRHADGAEVRLSYAELYVSDVLWPDFQVSDLHGAIRAFASRNRRFGALDHTNTPRL